LRIPIALLLLSLVVSAAYRFAPNSRSTLRSLMPGALLAVALWAFASLAFAFLVPLFPDYGAVYGSFGAAISLLIYLYASALAVLLGAEVNAARTPDPWHKGTSPKTTRKG
jgi:membrane protein